jgi:hypothetical protein
VPQLRNLHVQLYCLAIAIKMKLYPISRGQMTSGAMSFYRYF